MMTLPAETPIEDHVERAVYLMEMGASMVLGSIPDDTTQFSASFKGEVSKAIAAKLNAAKLTENEVIMDLIMSGVIEAWLWGVPGRTSEMEAARLKLYEARSLYEAAGKNEG